MALVKPLHCEIYIEAFRRKCTLWYHLSNGLTDVRGDGTLADVRGGDGTLANVQVAGDVALAG